MKKIKSEKGLTLVEIIVSIAVLGIIITSILSMFDVSITETFKSGNRSKEAMEVQQIVDDLQAEFQLGASSINLVNNYMTGKGYYKVTSLAVLDAKVGSNDVNYFTQEKTIVKSSTTVRGYEVQVLKFFNNGKNSVHLTTFISGSVST